MKLSIGWRRLPSFDNARKLGAECDLFRLDFHKDVVLGKAKKGVTARNQELENQNIKLKRTCKYGGLFKSGVEVFMTVIQFFLIR